jgi:YD repeat-containing protein
MKKKVMMKSILLAFMTAVTAGASAQTTWVYTYDAVGNRTQRTVNTGSKARQKTTTLSKDLMNDEKIKAVMENGNRRLKVETLGRSNVFITIYDLTGKELISRKTYSETTYVDLSTLHRGTYILAVELENEKKTCKFNK